MKSGQVLFVLIGGDAAEASVSPGPERVLQPCGGRAAGPADTLIGPDGRVSRIERCPITLSRIALSSIQAVQRPRRRAPGGYRGDDTGRVADVQQGGEHRIARLGQMGENGSRDALLVEGGDHFTTPSHRPRA